MRNTIQLDPHTIIEDRPFTHPDQTPQDRRTLCYMATWLSQTLQQPDLYSHSPDPLILLLTDEDQRRLRLVITQVQRLLELSSLALVGFFGQQRTGLDRTPLDEVDEDLIEELPEHEDLLSYCTLTHLNGAHSNLVLFANAGAKMHWRDSVRHAKAVRELAPAHYHSIRIYNGNLSQGLTVPDALQLTKVKYYAYEQGHIWRAERNLNNQVNGKNNTSS